MIEEDDDDSKEVFVLQGVPVARNVTFREMWNMKMAKEVAFAYFCVNLIRFAAECHNDVSLDCANRYTIYMWLPLFLYHERDHSNTNSGWISVAFEVGCLIGSPLLGYLSDRCATFSGAS